MRIVFKKIPKLAIYLYLIGFVIMAVAFYLFFYSSQLIDPVTLQQLFIAGAIIVAIGSVVNNLSQFKKTNKSDRQD